MLMSLQDMAAAAALIHLIQGDRSVCSYAAVCFCLSLQLSIVNSQAKSKRLTGQRGSDSDCITTAGSEQLHEGAAV